MLLYIRLRYYIVCNMLASSYEIPTNRVVPSVVLAVYTRAVYKLRCITAPKRVYGEEKNAEGGKKRGNTQFAWARCALVYSVIHTRRKRRRESNCRSLRFVSQFDGRAASGERIVSQQLDSFFSFITWWWIEERNVGRACQKNTLTEKVDYILLWCNDNVTRSQPFDGSKRWTHFLFVNALYVITNWIFET